MQPPLPSAVMAQAVLLLVTVTVAGTVARLAAAAPPGQRPPRWRRASLAAGTALLLISFFSPLATLAGRYLLTAHLLQVTLVMGFAPPLLLAGLPGGARQGPAPWLCRAGRIVAHPVVAIVVVNAVFFAWHATVPYNAALRDPALYSLQQVSLLLVSLAFWWPIAGPGAGMPAFHKLGYILLATIPQTFAGLTVALVRHPLYDVYAAAPRVFGLSAISDQQIAGACMALVSKLALFAAFTVVFSRALRDGASDDDGGWRPPAEGPQGPAPAHSLTPSPGFLDLLAEGRTVVEPAPSRERTLSPLV